MAWQLSGQLIEACSCKSACPCVLGPAEPDQGWCSGALTFSIDKGQSDGVDLSGRARCLARRSAQGFCQRQCHGLLGHRRWGRCSAAPRARGHLLRQEGRTRRRAWQPCLHMAADGKRSDQDERGREPEITVGTMGHVKLQPIKDQAGKTATLVNAPILGLVDITEAKLARSDGSRFAAPQMRSWTSGGHGSVSPFSWKA